jgi:hypothetical protein
VTSTAVKARGILVEGGGIDRENKYCIVLLFRIYETPLVVFSKIDEVRLTKPPRDRSTITRGG